MLQKLKENSKYVPPKPAENLIKESEKDIIGIWRQYGVEQPSITFELRSDYSVRMHYFLRGCDSQGSDSTKWYSTGTWNSDGNNINAKIKPEIDLNPKFSYQFEAWKNNESRCNFCFNKTDLGKISKDKFESSIEKVTVDDIENYWSLLATKELGLNL